MSVPYETATSGERARGEIRKHLQRFGCETVGFMDEFAPSSGCCWRSQWRGHRVQLRASARGRAELHLRENPWNNRRRCSEQEWEERAAHHRVHAKG